MLTHYLDYLSLLTKDLKRKGISLFDIDKYQLENQVLVLEEFFYLNEVFRKSGGEKFVPSQYKFDVMSYLREKISEEYSDTWAKEFDELTRQPDNAGKIECDIERIDNFIEKLGLKTREVSKPATDEHTLFSQNISQQNFLFSYSGSDIDFEETEGDTEDEELDLELDIEDNDDQSYDSDDEDEVGDFGIDSYGDDEDDVLGTESNVIVIDFEENIPLEDLFPSGGISSSTEDDDDEVEDLDIGTEDEDLSLDGGFDEEIEEDISLDEEVSIEEADIINYPASEVDDYEDEYSDDDFSVDEEEYYEDDDEELDLGTDNYDEDLEEYGEIEEEEYDEEDEDLDLSAGLEDEDDSYEEEEEDDLDLDVESDFTEPDSEYDDEDEDDFSISDYMYSDEPKKPQKQQDVVSRKIPTKKQNEQRSNEKHADALCKWVNKGVRLGSKKLSDKLNGGSKHEN